MASNELLNCISVQFSRLHNNGRSFGGITVIRFGYLL